MNLVLGKRDILMALSPSLVDDLDAIVIRVNLVFGKEHDPQTGAHSDISVTGFNFKGTTQATVGAAGGASALPATPTGYLVIEVNGSEMVVPYYAKS